MSQHDFTIDNQGFPAFRSDLNNALQALASINAGATAPSTTFAYQLWADTANGLIKMRNSTNDGWVTWPVAADGSIVSGGAIDTALDAKYDSSDLGVTVQAYDADTAKTDVAQSFTAAQRGTVTTDNDLSFDMSATNNFKCTPTGSGTLTFTNITAGQSGNIWLDNSGAYVISAAATVYISAADLAKINTAGVYFVSYFSADGTNVAVSVSSAVTSAGA